MPSRRPRLAAARRVQSATRLCAHSVLRRACRTGPTRAQVTVHGISIDQNLMQISGIDPARVAVIKLDIQGHEYEALAGAIATIRTARPVLYFEFSPFLFGKIRSADANKVLCLPMLVGGYKCTIPIQGELAFCVPERLNSGPGPKSVNPS